VFVRLSVKAGDLVKRDNSFVEWAKHNALMSIQESKEIGIVIKIIKASAFRRQHRFAILWSYTGLSWEDQDSLELISDTAACKINKTMV